MSDPGPSLGAAVILAAGASRRMGTPKALLPFGRTTFVEHLWELLAALPLGWKRVVTSPSLPLGLPSLVNPETARGPIGSIQAALRHGARDFPWLLVMAVDRPQLRPETLACLCQAAATGQGALWVPTYRGRRGHPILFSRGCYDDLMAAPDEPGARWVVGRHRHRRVEVAVEDPAVVCELDTPEQLEKAGLFRPTFAAGATSGD